MYFQKDKAISNVSWYSQLEADIQSKVEELNQAFRNRDKMKDDALAQLEYMRLKGNNMPWIVFDLWIHGWLLENMISLSL